ncbi:hypothetical protein ACQ4PT_012397 [Festuca glaucescens]
MLWSLRWFRELQRENEGPGPSKKKKEDKDACFRCKKPGHYIDDCTTPYCDICESVHHVSSACHLLQAPKPTAIIHGYANEALMFFEMPCGAFKAKVENPKLAKVTVEGEVMTIPEIIEQMKRIVPYEKFHWEVFHYKDNICRMKLPSKQEVQRLKNFGSYVCPQKETILFFDLWSLVEEPLYMLPEVWVRVAGVPSDMRADYLSLWGIGSLFGKTLDVDMPFTRKNKLLRIKIGCLDRNLIPADSDVFIRRGFYKLCFEVEAAHVAQEVNMVEDDATSNNNGQDENSAKSGVEGMQEQCQQVDEIQIGTLKVQLSPIDLASDRSSSGLPRVGANVASAATLSADSQQHSRRSWGGAADSVGRQQLDQSEATAAVVAASGASPLVEMLQQAAVKDAGPRLANGVQEHEKLVGSAGDQRRSSIASEAGSFVAMQKDSRPLLVSSQAQKIRPAHEAATAVVHGDSANHWAPHEPMTGPGLDDQGGLSAHGPCLDPIMVGPFKKHIEDAMGSALSEKKGEKSTVDLQGRMRNASSMKNTVMSETHDGTFE